MNYRLAQYLLKLTLGLDQLVLEFLGTNMSHVGMRHSMRSDRMAMASHLPNLVPSHHWTLFGIQRGYIQMLLNLSYSRFLFVPNKASAVTGSRLESCGPIPLFLYG